MNMFLVLLLFLLLNCHVWSSSDIMVDVGACWGAGLSFQIVETLFGAGIQPLSLKDVARSSHDVLQKPSTG